MLPPLSVLSKPTDGEGVGSVCCCCCCFINREVDQVHLIIGVRQYTKPHMQTRMQARRQAHGPPPSCAHAHTNVYSRSRRSCFTVCGQFQVWKYRYKRTHVSLIPSVSALNVSFCLRGGGTHQHSERPSLSSPVSNHVMKVLSEWLILIVGIMNEGSSPVNPSRRLTELINNSTSLQAAPGLLETKLLLTWRLMPACLTVLCHLPSQQQQRQRSPLSNLSCGGIGKKRKGSEIKNEIRSTAEKKDL